MLGHEEVRRLAEVTVSGRGLTCEASIWLEADRTLGASLRATRDGGNAGRIDTEGHPDLASLKSCFEVDLLARATALGWDAGVTERLLRRSMAQASRAMERVNEAWETQEPG